MPKVRGCLSLADRHEEAISAKEIIVSADPHVPVVSYPFALEPDHSGVESAKQQQVRYAEPC